MIKRVLLVLLPAIVVGCGDGHFASDRELFEEGGGSKGSPPIAQSAPPFSPPSPGNDDRDPAPPEPARAPTDEPALPAQQPAERQIIRSGEIALTVPLLDSAERAVTAIATAAGGYASNSSRHRSEGNAMTGTLQIRVPAASFQNVLASVRKLGEVERESVSSSDVTEEYLDLNARLKTQQELETRLLKLLAERTGKLADIIEIESKLAEVRSQIERIQGRLRYLQGQVSYSTLSVTMFEPGAVGTSDTETFGGRLVHALESGIDGLISVLGGLITIAIALIPVAALLVAAYLLLRPAWRRRKARRSAERNAARDEKSSPP